MADVCVKMPEDCGSEGECREERRRRIVMRPLAATVVAGDPPTTGRGEKRPEVVEKESSGYKRCRTEGEDRGSSSSAEASTAEAAPIASTSSATTSMGRPPPPFGSVAVSGRTREMEDAVSLRPAFYQPEGAPPFHYFAVFDGHGGSHVSMLCKDQMHLLLAEELRSAAVPSVETEEGEAMWRGAVARSFARMDELALAVCACGSVGLPTCSCDRSSIESLIVGSTAVVSLLGGDRLIVANCGDSRAVLSRGGRAIPLSNDHKPDRPDELARIEAAGDRVIYVNGARVRGILAMSRALGDKYLKPVVISEPEVVIMERTPEDECMIIASDGLWDVLSNELACDVARRCLEESNPTSLEDVNGVIASIAASGGEEEHMSNLRCSLAAALLTRLALGRKSADNISVIVVDLRGWAG